MVRSVLVLLPLFFAFNVFAGESLALTWKNKYGKWFACGPVQCTGLAKDSESEALKYVYLDNKHDIYNTHQTYGRCKVYKVTNVDSYESSAEVVQRLSSC